MHINERNNLNESVFSLFNGTVKRVLTEKNIHSTDSVSLGIGHVVTQLIGCCQI